MEKIIVKVIVDGEELASLDMGEGREDFTYRDEIVFYSGKHIYNKDGTFAPYSSFIRLARPKKEDLEK